MATVDVEVPQAKSGKAGTKRIQCVVVTPERTLFDELVDFVALPLYDGELGVLPGRTPLIGRLGFGVLRTKSGGSTRRTFVDGGFVQIRDDVVTVLTNRATPAELVNTESAVKELATAQAIKATSDFEIEEKTKAIARARARIHAGTVARS